YTPQSMEGSSLLDTNSKRMDPTNQANVRLTKGIQLPGGNSMRVFIDVENIFKAKNINRVYPRTGSP
ncbi:MAG TPA: hypothetical protein DG355_08065, partial [Candidatus Cloacimonas sp.]|nr:hypothetical protein [Candidatus Cloacimonas sp.]